MRQWPNLAPHFENVPHPRALRIIARGKIYHEQNLHRSPGIGVRGLLRLLLLNSGRGSYTYTYAKLFSPSALRTCLQKA
jgi:hypothetical protein